MARETHLDDDLSDLLADPPPLPGWPEARWRRLLGQGCIDSCAPAALGDRRLHRVVRWATSSRSRPENRMGAAAASLAVVDRAVQEGRHDPARVAGELDHAVRSARPLTARFRPQSRMSPSATMDRRPALGPAWPAPMDSPLVAAATTVLHRAGIDLRRDPALAARLSAALDVAVEHWTAGAAPGGGLPEFAPEGGLRSTKRLAVRLGGDRNLHALVYGPQPGRGRPLQVARQRGLAYWVAVTLRADRIDAEPPSPPAPVVGHWRTELDRLRAASQPAEDIGTNSLDTPSA